MTSTSDLAKIRTEQDKLMPDTVYIQRLTRTPDGAGGWSETWQTVATTKGRIAPGRGGEEVKGGAMTAYGEHIITLPHGTDVSESDRLQVNGVQYEIKAILSRSEQTALRMIVTKV